MSDRAYGGRAHERQTKRATNGGQDPNKKEVDMISGSFLQLTILLVDNHTRNRDTSKKELQQQIQNQASAHLQTLMLDTYLYELNKIPL